MKEIDRVKKERDHLKDLIGGRSVFVVSRKWDDATICATLYRREEAKDGTFIRLSLCLEDFGKMIETEMGKGATIQQALDIVLKGVKEASSEAVK